MAEGARLESVYTGNRIEGSNPSFSATSLASDVAPPTICRVSDDYYVDGAALLASFRFIEILDTYLVTMERGRYVVFLCHSKSERFALQLTQRISYLRAYKIDIH